MNNIYYNFIGVVILISLNTSCMSQIDNMSNTRWVYDFGDCKDYIRIKGDNHYEFFSCETGDTVYGNYLIDNDTLFLRQLKGSFDEDFGENSRHRIPSVKFKLIIDKKRLRFIERWEIDANGKWHKTDFSFPSDYLFRKI